MIANMTRALAPVLLIVLVAVGFLRLDPLSSLTGDVPPVEDMNVERIVLDEQGMNIQIRAAGSQGITLAQVQVDGAYWRFEQTPPGPLPRLAGAWVRIPYQWVQGEAHHITFLTSTGATFDYSIDVAVATPKPGAGMMRLQALIGLFVGVVPVVLGMLFYPAMRRAGPGMMVFALALTVGLLAYLFVDTMAAAMEAAADTVTAFSTRELIWLVMLGTAGGLFAVGQLLKRSFGTVMLAWSIALSVGLHNFGEGLAIGSAFATGAVALGSYLVLGFTLHNVTEGVGIVAPLTDRRPSLVVFAALAALAGVPAVFGIWLGAFAFNPFWAALALAVGAGAILQVLIEVGSLIHRRYLGADGGRQYAGVLAGGLLGVVIMYGTSLVVAA